MLAASFNSERLGTMSNFDNAFENSVMSDDKLVFVRNNKPSVTSNMGSDGKPISAP